MNRNPLAAFFLAAALLMTERMVAQENPVPKAWHQNAGDIARVTDMEIDAYAQFAADTILATYRDNAAKGRHTLVLIGENHAQMPHLLLQGLINTRVMAALSPEQFLYTMEEPKEDEPLLAEMTCIAARDTASLGQKAHRYSRVYETSGHEFRVMNMLDILGCGYNIRFVDATRDARNDAYLDSLTLCRLEQHDALKKPTLRRHRRWRENPWSCGTTAETGMMFRNLAMMENESALLKERTTPTLVIHSGGGDHLFDSDLPFSPTMLSFAPDKTTIGLFSLLMLVREDEEKFQAGRARAAHKPKLNLVVSFEKMTADVSTRYKSDWKNWRDLCSRNKAPRYVFE